MAKYEAVLRGNINTIILDVEKAINGSISSTTEESSVITAGNTRVYVRVYERYSYFGENRVSLSITYVVSGDDVYVTAITSGGGRGMFLKILPVGEQTFLNSIVGTLDRYKVGNL